MLYDKDRLDAAYAKVGLFADTAWQVNDNDDYIRANQELWMQECSLKKRSENISIPKTVLDTIPNSRLAEYGTYIYDEVRECAYEPTYNYSAIIAQPTTNMTYVNHEFRNEDLFESQEVEKLFNILTDTNSNSGDIEGKCRNFIKTFEMREISPEIYTLVRKSDSLIKTTISADCVESETEVAFERIRVRKNKTRSRRHTPPQEIRSLWAPQETLNMDVPEFYPTFHQPDETCINYEMVPNVQSWLNHGYPLRHSDFHELAALSSDMDTLGVLIPHHATPKPAQQQLPLPAVAPPVADVPKEIPLLPVVIPKEIPTTTRRLYSAVLQNHVMPTVATVVATTVSSDELDELEREAIAQYRPSNENLAKISEDSIISAKFQELERLALEQYNSASATETSACATGELGECSTSSGNATNPLHEPPCGGKVNPYAALLLANSVLAGFYRSRLLSFLSSGARFR